VKTQNIGKFAQCLYKFKIAQRESVQDVVWQGENAHRMIIQRDARILRRSWRKAISSEYNRKTSK